MIYSPNGTAVAGRNLVTYQQLYMIMADIQRYQISSPAFMIFNGPKIKRFYDQNAIRIQTLQKNINALADKYVKKTEDGKFTVIKSVGVPDQYEFISDEAKQKYDKEFAEFMNLSFELHV